MVRQKPLQNGSGRGVGQAGGRRLNRNTGPCKSGGIGRGKGAGRGKGQGRNK